MYIMRTSCEDQNLQNPGTEVRIIDNDGAPGRPPRGRGWTGPLHLLAFRKIDLKISPRDHQMRRTDDD